MMNAVSDVAAARVTSNGSCEHEGVRNVCQADEVHKPSSAPTLDSVPCSPGCLHASSVLPGYPTLVVTFFDYLPRTLAHVNAVLADAIRACSTRLYWGGGGFKVGDVAPECLGAPRARCGRFG